MMSYGNIIVTRETHI